MPSHPVHQLLCPVCRDRLDYRQGAPRSLVCPQGHSFDAARQGYFNFLVGKGTSFEADSADMVAARADFLSRGHYQPLAETIADAADAAMTSASPTVLDAGTGTGHYLRSVLDRHPAAGAIGLDISKFALRRAARMNPEAINIVSDVWQPLPVADDAVDVVTVVFAPRNPVEFARVLRPAGMLLVVTPRPGHLEEVAGVIRLLAIEAAKEERLVSSLGGHFDQESVQELDLDLVLPAKDVVSLALMGPAGHHLDRSSLPGMLASLQPVTKVSARFRITSFKPRMSRSR